MAWISGPSCEHRERELQGHWHRGRRHDDDVLGTELRDVNGGLLDAAASDRFSATLSAAAATLAPRFAAAALSSAVPATASCAVTFAVAPASVAASSPARLRQCKRLPGLDDDLLREARGG
jgi:hypothetical protein